jgi:hypothetical protein
VVSAVVDLRFFGQTGVMSVAAEAPRSTTALHAPDVSCRSVPLFGANPTNIDRMETAAFRSERVRGKGGPMTPPARFFKAR